MIKKNILFLTIPFLVISFLSCSSGDEENQRSDDVRTSTSHLPDDGIEIENAWARPGSENGVSAIYMAVLNGSSEADSVIAVSSPAAGMAEIHESYEREEGMMGMRPAGNLIIPARDAVYLEPGGLHVMLMSLNRGLANGDEIEFTIEFANAGKRTLRAPVQTMQ